MCMSYWQEIQISLISRSVYSLSGKLLINQGVTQYLTCSVLFQGCFKHRPCLEFFSSNKRLLSTWFCSFSLLSLPWSSFLFCFFSQLYTWELSAGLYNTTLLSVMAHTLCHRAPLWLPWWFDCSWADGEMSHTVIVVWWPICVMILVCWM